MEIRLETIKNEIIRLLQNIDTAEWDTVELVFEFPPFLNKGFNTLPLFLDRNGNRLRTFLKYDDDFTKAFYSFVFRINTDHDYNQINFSAKKGDYDNAIITVSFNEVLSTNFLNNIPASKRGKNIPWWRNPEETKDLIK
ncbi:hypothetical protein [Ferruginibacter sp.]